MAEIDPVITNYENMTEGQFRRRPDGKFEILLDAAEWDHLHATMAVNPGGMFICDIEIEGETIPVKLSGFLNRPAVVFERQPRA